VFDVLIFIITAKTVNHTTHIEMFQTTPFKKIYLKNIWVVSKVL